MLFAGCPEMLAKHPQHNVFLLFSQGLQDINLDCRLIALKAAVIYINQAKHAVRTEMASLLPLILNVRVANLDYPVGYPGKGR